MQKGKYVIWMALVAIGVVSVAGAASAGMTGPLQVELRMPAFPQVGQQGTIYCTISSEADLKGVQAKIDLPQGVHLVNGKTTWNGDIAAMESVYLELTVRVAKPGNKTVTATALCRVGPHTTYSDMAQVFFNSAVGSAAEGHVTGFVETETPAVSATGQVSTLTKKTDAKKLLSVPDFTPEPSTDVPGGKLVVPKSGRSFRSTVVVSGRWCYYDRSDAQTGMRYIYIQLLNGSTNAVLASTYIGDTDGYYTFPSVTNPGAAGFKVKAYCFYRSAVSCDDKALRVVTLNSGWTDGGNTTSNCYTSTTGVRTTGESTYDMGTWTITNGTTNERAWWIIHDLTQAFWWPYGWNSGTTMNGGVTVEWSSTSTHGDHNHRGSGLFNYGGNIHLKAASPDVCDVVLHEYGHEAQEDGYGQWLPTSDCPSPHYFEAASGPTCAWMEGFANWFKFAVSNDPVYHWAGGGSVDCENQSWGNGWDEGDEVEGRVAGALWDIGDSNADGYDTCNLDWEVFWDTWWGSGHRDSTFSQFWTRWVNAGNLKHHPVKALFQSTIDYNTWPTFTGLPDLTVAMSSSNDNILDPWLYTSDPESGEDYWNFDYAIVENTNPDCGVSFDEWYWLDINPTTGWTGSSTVTISCTDGIRTVTDTMIITVTP